VVGLEQAGKQVLLQAGNPLKVYLKIPPMPVHNPKCTRHELNIYAPPVTQTVFREKKYLWCKHSVKTLSVNGDEVYLALPPLTIVFYHFSTGSWRHTHKSYSKLFYIASIGEAVTLLDQDLSLSHENLVQLPEFLKDFDKVKTEMEVEGYAASQRLFNVNVNAYRILLLYRQCTSECTSVQAQSTPSIPSISGRVSSISFSFQGGEER
jgi:hypothetical protein